MPPDLNPQAPPIRWRSYSDAARLIGRGVTFGTASRICLVVGTLLTLVNQAGVLLNGEETPLTWVRIGFNYLIPYVVASLGYLAPFRTAGRDAP